METIAADSRMESRNLRRQTRRRHWLKRGVVFLFSALLSLVSVELVVRGYVYCRGWTSNCYVGSITLLVPDPMNGYTLAEDYRFRSGAQKISINRFGLRGPAVEEVRPMGTHRVAVIGGSSVFGYLVSDGEEACRVLENRLRSNGDSVEVLNGGVPGYNLIQSSRRFDSHISRLEPDVVILYLGWNDLVYLLDETPSIDVAGRGLCASTLERMAAYSTLYGLVAHRLLGQVAEFNPPSHSGTQPTPAGSRLFQTALQSTVSRVRQSGAEVIICSQAMLAHPEVGESAKLHLAGRGSSADHTIALGVWLQDALALFATANDIPFVDAYNEIPPTSAMLGDVIHLTVQGESELAAIWERELTAIWAQQ
jgi:lysophospholipase L1-like esterase